jgi:integrase
MKIEKHGEKYRVRKMYRGNLYILTFDKKPSPDDIQDALLDKILDATGGLKGSFGFYAKEYIKNRSNVCSPATIRTYNTKYRQLSDKFTNLEINSITANDVQTEINSCAEKYEPKTVKTLHGFIASVLRQYRPRLVLSTKLPQAIKKPLYEPTSDDIKRIIELAKGTKFSVAIQLGVMGCRRAEICAASINDIDENNNLNIHRSMVYDENNRWIIKESPKTDESNRMIPLPPTLADEIREQGYIFIGHPNSLNKAIHRFQKELGIPTFKFHSLRSYFASYAHSMGIPESDILSLGGWKTDNVMKNVYRKSLEESKKMSVEKIYKGIWG